MWVEPEYIAVAIALFLLWAGWYIGFQYGCKQGAAEMFEQLEEQEYIRTYTKTDSDGEVEVILIEPEWKTKPGQADTSA